MNIMTSMCLSDAPPPYHQSPNGIFPNYLLASKYAHLCISVYLNDPNISICLLAF